MNGHDIVEHWNIEEKYYKGGSSSASGSRLIVFNLSITLKDCDCTKCIDAKEWLQLALMDIENGCRIRMFGGVEK